MRRIVTDPIAFDTTTIQAPMNRNDGPASLLADSTVPNLKYRPVAYSIKISGMDQIHRKQHQTIKNTSAPKGIII